MTQAVAEPIISASSPEAMRSNRAEQDPLRLRDFRDLIANMPVAHQAFTSKKLTWASHMAGDNAASAALTAIFGQSEEVTLSRSDLRRFATKEDPAQFVMATILWGYPRGMRGNNVASLIRDFGTLMQLLASVRVRPVDDWKSHYAELAPITGVGLSTYTKFLTFLSIPVRGYHALILDDRIIRIVQSGIFQELTPLHGLKNPIRSYPRYLECMHRVAGDLVVSAERLEFFLFEFGLNLKSPACSTSR